MTFLFLNVMSNPVCLCSVYVDCDRCGVCRFWVYCCLYPLICVMALRIHLLQHHTQLSFFCRRYTHTHTEHKQTVRCQHCTYSKQNVVLLLTYTQSQWEHTYTTAHSKSVCVSANPRCKTHVSGGLFFLSAAMFHHSTRVCVCACLFFAICVQKMCESVCSGFL